MNNFLAKAKLAVNNNGGQPTQQEHPKKLPGMPPTPPSLHGKPLTPPSFKGKPLMPKKNVEKEEPKEEVKATENAIPEKVEAPLAKKNNQFINPQKNVQAKEIPTPQEVEEVVETSEEVKTEVVEEVKKENKKVSKKKEEPKKEKEETEKVVVEEKEEVKEEKPKKRKTTKKKASTVEETTCEEIDLLKMPESEVSYEEALKSINPSFENEEWKEIREDLSKRLNEIEIDAAMKSSALKATLSELDKLKTAVQFKFADVKTFYENLTNKDNGLIETTKKFNSVGSNAEERKLNGLKAICNFKNEDGKIINLLEVLYEIRSEYNYLEKFMELIQYKTTMANNMLYSQNREK